MSTLTSIVFTEEGVYLEREGNRIPFIIDVEKFKISIKKYFEKRQNYGTTTHNTISRILKISTGFGLANHQHQGAIYENLYKTLSASEEYILWRKKAWNHGKRRMDHNKTVRQLNAEEAQEKRREIWNNYR